MPLTIYTSNRMEELVNALASIVMTGDSDPLTPEIIVMQSKGMQRWLTMELAGRFGVWANCHYPFPNALLEELFSQTLKETGNGADFSREVMTWKILKLLPELLKTDAARPLQHYLADDRDGLKRFQLAGQIADTFDQYTLFRPEMLLAWENGGTSDDAQQWQAQLWRSLVADSNCMHRGRLKELFCRRLSGGAPPDPELLPARMAVFGVSYLPAYHLQILGAVSRFTEINLFLLSPSREYWADIIPIKKQLQLPLAKRSATTEGNPLLASLGKLGRDFSDMAIAMGELAAAQEDLYVDPGSGRLLHCLQSDMLNLRGYGKLSSKRLLPDDDNSIQIHSCHNPMREIEALHDNLLALLDSGSGIECRDILVMTPDIETYTPYISAVFEGNRDPARTIPYSIADLRLVSDGQIASVFLKLLDLPGSRLTVVQLLDILAAPPVLARFELTENDLPLIRNWLEETRVCWGMDEQQRLGLGLAGYRDNSWLAALDRLLLGYAMPDDGRLFHNILPFDGMEGTSTRILGCLVSFVQSVRSAVAALSAPRPLTEWREQLKALLTAFISNDDSSAFEQSTVSTILDSLGSIALQAGFSADVEPAVIRNWLAARLQQEEKGLGFMTGGVTFCAMLPMRSIPFRVIALVGMNDGAFPRQNHPPGFDLIARHPKSGDRSLRDEDRYLFLEALLSARDCLYISYIGQSMKDNSEIPPCVLTSELLDAIERGFCTGGELTIEQRLLTRHRLQAFSSDYFREDSGLFSYSTENCAALLQRSEPGSGGSGFLSAPLPLPDHLEQQATLADLIRFFGNPSRFFLEKRLRVRLRQGDAPLEEREPFGLDSLTAYGLKSALLQSLLEGNDPGAMYPAVRARGLLPPAGHGELLFTEAVKTVRVFADEIMADMPQTGPLPPLDIALDIDGMLLSGRLERIWPQQMLRYRCARLKAKDLLAAWIEHLALNAAALPPYPRQTLLIQSDVRRLFPAVKNAPDILRSLVRLYRKGLTAPLRFFPESSLAYAQKGELEKAYRSWNDGFNSIGEGSEPHFRRCFGETDPFDEEFTQTADSVLRPLLDCLQQEQS